jgi:thymidylate synthase|tara:strand:- start:8200 stop:9309 length:1110 start_codon:yes stop_codon:yes gene_type:complete
MNNLDEQYQDLLQDILDNGTVKKTRNGGTISVFGRQIRHNMEGGFPLLTSKKMATKQIITELLWFLRGETNIQSLVREGNYIWVGDAYKSYEAQCMKEVHDYGVSPPMKLYPMLRKDFIENIKTDDDFAKKWGELGSVYGKQWRNWTAPKKIYDSSGEIPIGLEIEFIDQISEMIDKLKNRPDDRRNMVTAWNPAEIEDAVLPPCHYGFQVWTRELSSYEREDLFAEQKGYLKYERDGLHPNHSDEEVHQKMTEAGVPVRALSLMWNQRSCDVPLGIPFNIASYGALLQILSQMVNMVPDELIGNLGDTHIYLNQVEAVKEQIKRDSHKLPQLEIEIPKGMTDPSELKYENFKLLNYVSEDKITFELSN